MANICTFNHWWQSNFRKMETQNLKVKITLLRPSRWVSFYLCILGSFHLGHHRIVTYGKQKYSFVPHSHAILHIFCAFGPFVLLSPPRAFLSEFFIQAPLSIVSFCVRDVFNFQLIDGEEILAFCCLYDLVPCFDRYFFF